MRRRAAGPAPTTVPASVERALSGPSAPLGAGTRRHFESRLGQDFGHVRVHTGPTAAESARAVNAFAYTVGEHVVFDEGQYDPGSPRGAQLLAHELAHTLQQRGLRRSALLEVADSPEDARLEAEADSFARAIATSAPPSPSALRADRASVARLGRSWRPIQPPHPLAGSDADAEEVNGTGPSAPVALRIKTPFQLPSGKGPVLAAYKDRVAAHALEATIGFQGGVPNAALWQSRHSTYDLRSDWLLRVGWPAARAAALWRACGGKDPGAGGFPAKNPAVESSTCDMDHVVELQLGGTNVAENISPLDSEANRAAGRGIWATVSALASALRGRLPQPGPPEITLHFDSVEQSPLASVPAECSPPGQAPSCAAVAMCAHQKQTPPLQREGADAGGLTDYVVLVAGTPVVFRIDPSAEETDLLASAPENLNGAEAVPGLVLLRLLRPGGKSADEMVGAVESQKHVKRTKPTRVPIALKDLKGEDIHFTLPIDAATRHAQTRGTRGEVKASTVDARTLRLKEPVPRNLKFTYPYLSQGALTKLDVTPEGSLHAKGWIQPSIPLLPKVEIELAEGQLNGKVGVDPEKFKSPIPGLKITRSDVVVSLSPKLSATGTLDFRVGSAVDGKITAQVDDQGFVAKGGLVAHIPGVEKAEGEVVYRNGEWTGGIDVDASKVRLPRLQKALMHVGLDKEGVFASGGVLFTLPDGTPVDLTLTRDRKGRWVFTGTSTFSLPRLKPVVLSISYDGEHITGSASTDVDFKGLSGKVAVTYLDGAFSGKGDLAFRMGKKASGTASVRVGPQGGIHGSGSITYAITPDLVGTIGIDFPESGRIRARGELVFGKPLRLFAGIHRSVTLFSLPTIEIPILAIPLGVKSIGLVATVDASLGADFGVGPGELRDIKAMAAFDPLQDNPNLEVDLGARLVIPASAGLALKGRGGIGISGGIASVTGGLNLKGSARLEGGLDSAFKVHYARGVFAAEANAAIAAGLVLGLDLSADVTAKAGAFGISIEKTWEWPITGYKWDTGLKFKIEAPIRYESDTPFQAPSVDDLKFTPPSLDVKSLLPRVFASRSAKEEER